ncbi:MAG: ABC transporter permease [Alphaproteobacteria bacterium]|nr:ABC transporter permease [Alphaproteobacteria bacterium]
MTRNGPLALAYHALFVGFVLAPILIVCVVAFTPEGYLSVPTTHLSLRWFRAIANYPEFVTAFWNSVWLAALSSAIAVAFSVPAAVAIARHRFPGRETMTALFMSPLMIPHVVLGIAFLRFFTQIGLGGTFVGLVLSHIVIVLPFALRLVLASAVGLDRALEHAAISLGASDAVVFRRVTLPLILPGLASGWALAFIQSFDEVTMTVFIAAPSTVTLPVRMFLYIQDNIDPLVTSVSACVIVVTVLFMLLLDRLYGLERLLVGRGSAREE